MKSANIFTDVKRPSLCCFSDFNFASYSRSSIYWVIQNKRLIVGAIPGLVLQRKMGNERQGCIKQGKVVIKLRLWALLRMVNYVRWDSRYSSRENKVVGPWLWHHLQGTLKIEVRGSTEALVPTDQITLCCNLIDHKVSYVKFVVPWPWDSSALTTHVVMNLWTCYERYTIGCHLTFVLTLLTIIEPASRLSDT
jgi:hypothetical protein